MARISAQTPIFDPTTSYGYVVVGTPVGSNVPETPPDVPPPSPPPVTGWRLLMSEDFDTAVTLGTATASGSSTSMTAYPNIGVYPTTYYDTSSHLGRPAGTQGQYDANATVSVSGGILTKHLHTVGTRPKVCALLPQLPTSDPAVTASGLWTYQTYGRYEIVARFPDIIAGYKVAWLTWPISGGNTLNGEIDFPEHDLNQQTHTSAFLHHAPSTPSPFQHGSGSIAVDLTAWHTFTTEWTPGFVEFFIDGVSVFDDNDRIPAVPMRWVIQTETQLSSTPPSTSAAGDVEIDSVAVWAYDVAPPVTGFGNVLFTQAEMDAWPNTGTPYTATASSFVGNTSFVFTLFGSSITTSTRMQAFREQAVRAKGLAALWQADANAARLTKAIEYFDSVKGITSISATVGSDNLELSWAVMNFVPAAAMIGRANYDDAQFDSFLRNVCLPMLDWSTGGNWFATFAASRLAIASYLEDQTLYDDAKAYAEFRIGQAIYHSTYDGSTINPILGASHPAELWPTTLSQPPSPSATSDHWWTAVTTAPYTAQYGAYVFEDGVDAEMIRDFSHEMMGLTGWAQAALIIERTGDTVSADMTARIAASAAWLGRRVKYYLDNGILESASPPGTGGSPTGVGGSAYRFGWFTVKRLLGGAAPAVVNSLLADSDIDVPPSYAGANHQTIERFSEGTLV